MLTYKDIIKEEDNRLRKRSNPVDIPLSKDDVELLNKLNQYLENGYDEKLVEELGIRPGVGLASVQIGVLKRIFVIYAYDEKGELFHFGVVNPKIVSESVEQTFLSTGEGCLSIDRETEGLVHRPRKIVAKFHKFNFSNQTLSEVKMEFADYIAIVFQHEFDHLNGILFIDKINEENPFYIPNNSKPVVFTENDEEIEN